MCTALAAVVLSTGCNNDNGGETPPGIEHKLTVAPNSLTFSSDDAEPQTLTVTSTGAWEATAGAGWITLNPSSGEGDGTITVTVAAGTEARSSSITVGSSALSEVVIVNQTAPEGPVDNIVDSGTTGPLTWVFTDDGTLTVSGTGAMPDYDYDYTNNQSSAPWGDYLDGMMKVIVEEGVTGIGKYAFSHTAFLTEITLPDSVTSIGEYAFAYSEVLTEITIPRNVTSISDYTFLNCYALADVTLPDGLTSLGYMAFYDCMALPGITIPDTVTSIGNSCFGGCSLLATITIPDGITTIGSNCFNTCLSLAEINIPSSVTAIGTAAFFYCDDLTEITLPENLQTIGDEVFMGCTGLRELTIPAGVTSIGGMAFFNCEALSKLTVLPLAPPSLGFNPVSDFAKITLHVPANSLAAYKADSAWSAFTDMQALPAEVTFLSAEGYYWGVYWMDESVGEFSLNLRSYPVNGFGMAIGEGYKLELNTFSASTTETDVVDIAAGDYSITTDNGLMTINSAYSSVTYYTENAAASETLSIVGGTMKVEGSPAGYTITFNLELKDAGENSSTLKGQFTGVVSKMTI